MFPNKRKVAIEYFKGKKPTSQNNKHLPGMCKNLIKNVSYMYRCDKSLYWSGTESY